MIKTQIDTGPTCINAFCFGMRTGPKGETLKCREAIPYELFEKFCSESDMHKYNKWLLDSYVECSGVIKWCPKPGCKYAVEYTQGGSREITCRCGHVFCFLCGSTPHKPAPCDLVKKWRKQSGEEGDSADAATAKLLAAQAKQCPNCKIQIIKDKFCNHMHCTKCGHHFCWLCKKPWSGHSDYYNCSTYKDAAAKGEFSEEENKMMDSNKFMQKFMFFKQRYDNCARGVLKAKELLKKIEAAEKKNELEGPAFWLTEIVTQLTECHRMLQWTFCLGYYLKASGVKTLFEQKQSELVAKVDKFHELLESHSVKDLFAQMRKVKADAVSVVGSVTYFAELGTDALMDVIQHEADAESETWACVSCSTANPDYSDIKAKKKTTHCKKCTACRVHGEPECRSTLCRK
jgi:ariadne-1